MNSKIRKVLNDPNLVLILVFLINVPIFGLLNKPIGNVRDLYCFIDEIIPVIPPFILIYHSWFFFLLLNIFLLYKKNVREYRNLMANLIVGQWAAYLTFIFFQTNVTRASNLGNAVFDKLISTTYFIDNHYAGFPSVHALTTTALLMALWRSNHTKTYKLLASIYCILILASILLVKQHVFWDLPGGIIYAVALYPIFLILLNIVFPQSSVEKDFNNYN
ncbi:MAG: phosphatase PAP2 family protein [Tissierellia bacterium]|nr:phosphatase PAP2 family protein [Tissierellia bacterium]